MPWLLCYPVITRHYSGLVHLCLQIVLASMCLHIQAGTKWPPFPRWHFQVYFLEWKFMNFKWNFTEICSLGSNWQYGSIAADNVLAGAEAATSHYLKQWWYVLLKHICITRPQWVNEQCCFFMHNESKFGFILCQLVIILWKSFIS